MWYWSLDLCTFNNTHSSIYAVLEAFHLQYQSNPV